MEQQKDAHTKNCCVDCETQCPRCPKQNCCWSNRSRGGACGGVYGLIALGAAIYFIQQSQTFWAGVLGVLKALVWPTILAHKIFTLLGF